MVLILRLDQAKEVSEISLIAPLGYVGLKCDDPVSQEPKPSPPRWPMSLKLFEPVCFSSGNDSKIVFRFNATLGPGTWSLGFVADFPLDQSDAGGEQGRRL